MRDRQLQYYFFLLFCAIWKREKKYFSLSTISSLSFHFHLLIFFQKGYCVECGKPANYNIMFSCFLCHLEEERKTKYKAVSNLKKFGLTDADVSKYGIRYFAISSISIFSISRFPFLALPCFLSFGGRTKALSNLKNFCFPLFSHSLFLFPRFPRTFSNFLDFLGFPSSTSFLHFLHFLRFSCHFPHSPLLYFIHFTLSTLFTSRKEKEKSEGGKFKTIS